MSRLKEHRVLWLFLRALPVCVALFFLGRVIAINWSRLSAFPWQFRVGPLLGSLFLLLIALFFWAAIWRRMVVRSGCPIGLADGVRVYLLSNLAKYIPGSIWGYASRPVLGRSAGLTLMGVGVSVVWEIGIAVVASLLLSVATIPFYPATVPAPIWQLVLVAALGCLVGLAPPIANRWIRLLRRNEADQTAAPFGWADFSLFLGAALGAHVLVGTAFFLFARSLADLDGSAWWSFVGLWSLSATAGLLVVVVPYGFGVKEGLVALLLQPFLPIEAAALVAVASRLWTIAGDLLAAGIVALAFAISRFLSASPPPENPVRRQK